MFWIYLVHFLFLQNVFSDDNYQNANFFDDHGMGGVRNDQAYQLVKSKIIERYDSVF